MAFSLFKKARKKETLVVVFDIGSSSVGGALVLLSENNTPKIMYSVRKSMGLQDELDFDRFVSSMEDTVSVVAKDLEKNGLPHLRFTKLGSHTVRRVFCSLSSPWYASQTRVTEKSFDKPAVITEKTIKKILQKEEELFRESTATMNNIGESPLFIMEKQAIQIKLNGYETSVPYGKHAKQLGVVSIISVAQKNIIDSISKNIKRVFNVDNVEFNSFSNSLFNVLRSTLDAPKHFLMIDISGELTDLSIVYNGVLFETSTFPIGKNTIIRAMAEKLNVELEEAVTLLRLQNSDKIEEKQTERVAEALDLISARWVSSLQTSLSNLAEDLPVPAHVYITSDNDLNSFFEKLVKREEFNQYTVYKGSFAIEVVDTKLLHDLCSFGPSGGRDSFLIAGAVFAQLQSF